MRTTQQHVAAVEVKEHLVIHTLIKKEVSESQDFPTLVKVFVEQFFIEFNSVNVVGFRRHYN